MFMIRLHLITLVLVTLVLIAAALPAGAVISEEALEREHRARYSINYAAYLIDVGKYFEALENYQVAEELTSIPRTKTDALLAKATLLFSFLDAPEQALIIYRQLQRDYPLVSETAQYREGMLLFHLNRLEETQTRLQAYLDAFPAGRFRYQAEALLMEISKETPTETPTVETSQPKPPPGSDASVPEVIDKMPEVQATPPPSPSPPRVVALPPDKNQAPQPVDKDATPRQRPETTVHHGSDPAPPAGPDDRPEWPASGVTPGNKGEKPVSTSGMAEPSGASRPSARHAQRPPGTRASREPVAAGPDKHTEMKTAPPGGVAPRQGPETANPDDSDPAPPAGADHRPELPASRVTTGNNVKKPASASGTSQPSGGPPPSARHAQRPSDAPASRRPNAVGPDRDTEVIKAPPGGAASRQGPETANPDDSDPAPRPEMEMNPPLVRVRMCRTSGQAAIRGGGIGVQGFGSRDKCRLGIEGGRIIVDGTPTDRKTLTFTSEQSMKVVCGKKKKKVRGILKASISKGRLMIVNVLDIEQYLLAVVPSENPAGWPMESLKAQAVAARTYAYYQRQHRKTWSYDLVDFAGDQAYGGMDKEHKRSTKAVRETWGQILTHQGKPILAMYSANSGGHTADARAIFNLHKPYLTARPDPASLKGSMADWTRRSTVPQVTAALRKIRINARGLKGIEAHQRGPSGRIVKIRLVLNNGKTKILRNRTTLRRALNLPEILHDIRREGDTFIFEGHGWGHGVGYSQWGSAHLGKSKKYSDILAFYYGTAKMEKQW